MARIRAMKKNSLMGVMFLPGRDHLSLFLAVPISRANPDQSKIQQKRIQRRICLWSDPLSMVSMFVLSSERRIDSL